MPTCVSASGVVRFARNAGTVTSSDFGIVERVTPVVVHNDPPRTLGQFPTLRTKLLNREPL